MGFSEVNSGGRERLSLDVLDFGTFRYVPVNFKDSSDEHKAEVILERQKKRVLVFDSSIKRSIEGTVTVLGLSSRSSGYQIETEGKRVRTLQYRNLMGMYDFEEGQ